MWHTKMHFSAKCNSGRIAIQWFHIKHYLDYQYTKFQPYTFRVQKMCVFARYATLVPRLNLCYYEIRTALYMYIFQPCGRLEDTLADTLDKLVTSEVLRIEESQQVCFCNHIY